MSIGKTVGSSVYVHRDYESLVVPARELARAKEIAGSRISGYTCVRYNKRSKSIAFQFSPNFDTADEPIVGDTILVKADGNITVTPMGIDPMVWHHKWMWVGSDYEGFDVVASKKRSEQWKAYVRKSDLPKIGRKSYWDKIRKEWE